MTESDGEYPANAPAASQLVRFSIFTPNYLMAILLLGCLVLPGYKGCNGKPIHMSELVVESAKVPTQSTLLLFPQIFAIFCVIATTLLYLQNRQDGPQSAFRTYSVLALFHALFGLINFAFLLVTGKLRPLEEPDRLIGMLLLVGTYYLLPTIALYCMHRWRVPNLLRLWWIQLLLALAAFACAAFFAGMIGFFSEAPLIGGKINIVASACLVLLEVIQMMDGQRVLERGKPAIQLTLKQIFILVTLACVLTMLAIGSGWGELIQPGTASHVAPNGN